jgi:ADP-ribose pyrophosphatase YjhB (NUDIX family)
MSIVERRAARAIMLTPDHEVLMMRMAFPWLDEPLWILPGGGIEPGETAEQAVTREIFEETGQAGLLPGAAVWCREFLVSATSTLLKQQYFLVETERFEPRATELLGREQDWLEEYRWWSLEALSTTTALNLEPDRIVVGLHKLIREGPPSIPLNIDKL